MTLFPDKKAFGAAKTLDKLYTGDHKGELRVKVSDQP